MQFNNLKDEEKAAVVEGYWRYLQDKTLHDEKFSGRITYRTIAESMEEFNIKIKVYNNGNLGIDAGDQKSYDSMRRKCYDSVKPHWSDYYNPAFMEKEFARLQ